MDMQSSIMHQAQAWANNTFLDENSRKEIQSLIDKDDFSEIQERFYKDLEFGTGGIRSILGAGPNRINKYTIRKATYALTLEILNAFPDNKDKKVAISYDSRHFSFEFAKEASCVLAANNITALIYDEMNPVALLSFAVRHFKACAGLMITASHNPPKYNGFKAFWADGAQVTPPNDQNVIEQFNKLDDFSLIPTTDFDAAVTAKKIVWIGKDVQDAYFEKIKTSTLDLDLCQTRGQELKIVYTPIHGSGLVTCKRALEQIGLSNLLIVKEQAEGDPNFSTVSSPNPENPEALKLCVELMQKSNADIGFGSDPDTDRLGVTFVHNGEVTYLNGNQIGSLMLHYVLQQKKAQSLLDSNDYFIKTIVTTDLQRIIAESFNVKMFETLTGFKWICNKVRELESSAPQLNFLFGTEESFGYLNHPYVRDKDGVSSIALMAEIALYYKTQGMDLIQALDKIYTEYGLFHESLLALNFEGKEGSEKIKRIMNDFRNFSEKTICDQNITAIDDYDYQTSQLFGHDARPKDFSDLAKSNVLGFTFDSGDKLFLRPSGTEPKIKFYIMLQEKTGSLAEKKAKAAQKTQHFLDFLNQKANLA